MTEVAEPSAVPSAGPIVARAGRYYRNARYIMVLVGVVLGAYFLYDGYVGYPKKNTQIAAVETELNSTPKETQRWYELEALQRKLGTPKSGTDIALQKALGYLLPLASLAYLFYVLNKSRGELRLDGDVLSVPGHPAVPLSAVTSIDTRLWKKKGIAVVKYDVNGTKGVITLDDFVYEQTATDAVYDRLLAAKQAESPAPNPESPENPLPSE